MHHRRLIIRSNHPEVFLEKGVPKICSKFTGEHPRRSVISIKMLCCNFIEITLRNRCSPVNLPYIFRTPFPRNASVSLLLNYDVKERKILGQNKECSKALEWLEEDYFMMHKHFFRKSVQELRPWTPQESLQQLLDAPVDRSTSYHTFV